MSSSSTPVLARMDERVGELRSRFADFVRVFVKSERFTGPSWYFHRKTLETLLGHAPRSFDAFVGEMVAPRS